MPSNWEEEVVQAMIRANEHMAHCIDLINEQLKVVGDSRLEAYRKKAQAERTIELEAAIDTIESFKPKGDK